jgi:hypothetical protein
MALIKKIAKPFSRALPVLGAMAAAPLGALGQAGAFVTGREIGGLISPNISSALTQAITPTPTEEQIRDMREKSRRKALLEQGADTPGKRQTALTDTMSQSPFPFRLY